MSIPSTPSTSDQTTFNHPAMQNLNIPLSPSPPETCKWPELNIPQMPISVIQCYNNFDCDNEYKNIRTLFTNLDYVSLFAIQKRLEHMIENTRNINANNMDFYNERYRVESLLNEVRTNIPVAERASLQFKDKETTNANASADDGFKVVANKRKAKRSISSSSLDNIEAIQTQNKYSSLPTEEIAIDMETEQIAQNKQIDGNLETENKNTQKIHIPPVVIDDTNHGNAIVNEITKIISKPPQVKITKANFKIQTESVDDFKKINEYLQENKIPAHSYELQDEKQLKIVIRGLPIDMEISEIWSFLKSIGLNPIHISRLKHRSEKRHMPLVLVRLPRTPKSQEVFQITSISFYKVQIELLRRKKGAPQCYRCLNFFHNSKHCTRPFRCVKCGGNHSFADCEKKDRTIPPTCAHCGGMHTASYGGCPMQPKFKENNYRKTFKPAPEFNPWGINDNIEVNSSNFPSLPNQSPPANSTPVCAVQQPHRTNERVISTPAVSNISPPPTVNKADLFNAFFQQAINSIKTTQESLTMMANSLINLSQQINTFNE